MADHNLPDTAVTTGLADTSIFIARETGRGLGELPDRMAVSVVTTGELLLGVLQAADPQTRQQRAETLALAREIEPMPITEAVMDEWARLVARCRETGIHKTVKLTDSLIAATAVVAGIAVVTQDSDFDQLAQAYPVLSVTRV